MTREDIARMIDISTVRSDSTLTEVMDVVSAAKEHNFICVFVMPAMVDKIKDEMNSLPNIFMGGVVGFPSGADTTESKIFQAKEMLEKGCNEVDMVMNIGKLKSGLIEEVREDILRVKEVVSPTPLKVIIEVALLSDEEVTLASTTVKECEASFVKSGTGWHGKTTLHHVELMKEAVGDAIAIKVAGGVRDLETLLAMHNMGVSRFGIGYNAALSILNEVK